MAAKMKKTEYEVCVVMTNTVPIFRTVYTDGKDYFVKYDNKIRNVNHLKSSFLEKDHS